MTRLEKFFSLIGEKENEILLQRDNDMRWAEIFPQKKKKKINYSTWIVKKNKCIPRTLSSRKQRPGQIAGPTLEELEGKIPSDLHM